MKLLLATNHLRLGGSESYLLTVAEQLDRLGHEVSIYTREPGDGAEVARQRALEVCTYEGLPDHPDALLVQDAGVSYELAARYPKTPQVFVAHSGYHDLQLPPQLDGLISAIVTLNDRVMRRVEALAVETPLTRLCQPIDTKRFLVRSRLPERPRRALVLSNNLLGPRLAILESACADAGIELSTVGGPGGLVLDPRPALADADMVVGYGRSVLEAMACGRAAYVYDRWGGDGWVTADSYPDLEADGFGGRGTPAVIDPERLRRDLDGFDADMGLVNRDLIVTHHQAEQHTQALVKILQAAVPDQTPRGPLVEMARLVRLEWRISAEVRQAARENSRLRARVAELEAAGSEREKTLRQSRRETERLRSHYESTLSWRLTRPLRGFLGMLRSLRAIIKRGPHRG